MLPTYLGTQANTLTNIFKASADGNLDVIKSLIRNGSDLSIRDVNADTALHFASRNGHLEVVKTLIEEAMRLAAQKLPVKCKFVVRNDYVLPV
jgi:hypothetical protein